MAKTRSRQQQTGRDALQCKPARGGPGKRTRVDRVYGTLQRRTAGANKSTHPDAMKQTAASGFSGSATTLPHAAAIQRAFGAYDVSGIEAHVGGAAADACSDLGASAYAYGGGVAFASTPDLHTAAHETAHVVQQRAGVQLLGGIGQEGDVYEQHADAVADGVVRGDSVESLLDAMPGSGTKVQRKIARPTPLQLKPGDNEVAGVADKPSLKKNGTVARLYFFVDIDVKQLSIKDLKNGSVGHAWISLEYLDPHAVPDTVPESHRALLKSPGRYADPMGFWPDIQNNVYYSTDLFNSYVDGWMRHPDRAHQGQEKAFQVWELTQAEVDAVIAYAESKRGAKYSVYFFNCTTFAKEATKAAGKSPPSASQGGICFPNAAYNGIMARQKAKKGHTMTTDLDTNQTTEVEQVEGKSKKRQ